MLIPTKLSLEENFQAIKKLNLIQQYSKRLKELREDEIFEKNRTFCKHCDRNLLLPYKFEWTCFGCWYIVIKRKHELSKIQQELKNFINWLKYADHKTFCICTEVYEKYEGNGYNKKYDVFSKLEKKKSRKKTS